MARVVLVQHGQTEWNRVERFRGRIDVPLNETGHRQAEEAARVVAARYPVSAIYTSPLSRAADTAGAIGRATGAPVRVLAALNDFSYGEWEGKGSEIATAYPELYQIWRTRPHLAAIPGAESLRGLRRRVAGAVERISAQHSDETVVLVSHRMVCKVLACYILGLPNAGLWRLDLDTASVSLFERREDGWVTLLLNDSGHLRGLS
jgi:phosphoserine phosphatase